MAIETSTAEQDAMAAEWAAALEEQSQQVAGGSSHTDLIDAPMEQVMPASFTNLSPGGAPAGLKKIRRKKKNSKRKVKRKNKKAK